MNLFYERREAYIWIRGNTYVHREAIRSLGGRFVGDHKVWVLPFSSENLQKVQQLCDQPSPAAAPEAVARDEVVTGAEPSYSVSHLLARIDGVVRGGFRESVWVQGEVQNFASKRGAIYFDLAEADPASERQGTVTIKCFAWRNVLAPLLEKLKLSHSHELIQDGLQLRVQARVEFYRQRAQVSLHVLDLDPAFTQGALALAREQVLRQLRAQGLDRLNRRHTIATLPLRVGLLSSAGSRAQGDFIDQLVQGGFPGTVIFCNTIMQGEQTTRSVIAGIDQLVAAGCDLIVVTRGGGSAADLRWFDDKELAVAVCRSTVAVVAAIGHHDDFCVLEEVCHTRQKTPTAAAEFVLAPFVEARRELARSRERMLAAWARTWANAASTADTLTQQLRHRTDLRLSRLEQGLAQTCGRIERGAVEGLFAARRRVESTRPLLDRAAVQHVQTQLRRLEAIPHRIHAQAVARCNAQHALWQQCHEVLLRHDPTPWLSRGWTVLRDEAGEALRQVADARPGVSVTARLRDGTVRLRIECTQPHHPSSFDQE